KHYNLEVGLLKEGDAADCIVVEDLINFKILQTYIDGALVFDNGTSLIKSTSFEILNNFNTSKKQVSDFKFESLAKQIRVIEALEGQLVTNEIIAESLLQDGNLVSNVDKDILKMTVV